MEVGTQQGVRQDTAGQSFASPGEASEEIDPADTSSWAFSFRIIFLKMSRSLYFVRTQKT